MLSDLRFALRQFAKAPGVPAIIVLTLALSIGACTAIYSALDSIVLHPYDDPATERNVALRSLNLSQRTEGALSFPDFVDLERQTTAFEFMAHYSEDSVVLTRTTEPVRLQRNRSTLRYFDVFGVKMALGRVFLPGEFISGKENVVILGYACWQRTFGGAPDIVGRVLQLDETPCTVVGVTPERFERTGHHTDVWSPRVVDSPPGPNVRDPRSLRGGNRVFTIARLRRGVTIEQAQAELDVIAVALAERHPDSNKGFGMRADARGQPGQRIVVPIIQILLCAVGCLMLIACANVATLLLVRANARQREMALRAALGASRGRLIRQLLTENILVALVGGTAGVLLAQWALDFIRASTPGGTMNLIAVQLARLAHLELNGSVLAFALGLSVATALIFGLAPAWLSSNADLTETLKQGTRGSTEGRARGRFRTILVVAEIAMAVTLLACSGLLIRSFLKLTVYDPGFDPKRAAFASVKLGPATKYAKPEQVIAFIDALLARIRSAPGVEAVGTTAYLGLAGNSVSQTGFEIEGGPTISVAERPLAIRFSVSPDYFRAMGIPLKHGRFFSENDDAKAPLVAIVNQTLARQHFPNQNPIGKRITIANRPGAWRVIVGVGGDFGQAYVGEVPPPQLFEPRAQSLSLDLGFVVVRGHGDPTLLATAIKTQVQALDPNLPVDDMSTLEEFLRSKLAPERLTLHLLTAFAAIGLLSAAIGIYGVIAFSVSQRTVEIGIRMALGAQKQDVLRLVLGQGAWLIGIGFAVGIVATFVAGRAIESQLYNTSGSDPIALVGITVFFAAVAALACWLPARRATKVDPIVALRTE